MLPHNAHPHSHRNQNQAQTPPAAHSVISSSSVRYATPASLPPAFGVGPLHVWENTVATSTQYSPTATCSSQVGSLSSYTCSEPRTNNTFKPGLFSPQTPISTAEWVQQTSNSSVPPSVRSGVPSEVSNTHFRAPSFKSPLRNELDSYDGSLNDGDFDVDGSIPSSREEDEEEESSRPFSKYIDDAAQETGRKRKHKSTKSQPTRDKFVGDTGFASSEEESKVPKRRKENTKTTRASKKKPANKSKPVKSPTKPNRKQARQVESEDEAEPRESSNGGPVKNPKAARPGHPTKSVNPLNKWSGLSQGVLSFFPKLHNHNTDPTPLWTYSSDGITRQSPNHRALGDIHFSPSLALGEEFHYWVQVGTKEGGSWELYNPGWQHPAYAGYIFQELARKAPPCWFNPSRE
ncbi:hypothetical protein FRC08_010419 [Ceratobasidium sp. 394]|nr:hypothetical protein FRC08_010419 [Ceratobasidium sp. 394]